MLSTNESFVQQVDVKFYICNVIARKMYIKFACFVYIFMHVPDDDFVEKPECVALLDNKRYCLNINL